MHIAPIAISVGQIVQFSEEGWRKACNSIEPHHRLVPEMGRGPHRVKKVIGRTVHLDIPDFQLTPVPTGILEVVA